MDERLEVSITLKSIGDLSLTWWA